MFHVEQLFVKFYRYILLHILLLHIPIQNIPDTEDTEARDPRRITNNCSGCEDPVCARRKKTPRPYEDLEALPEQFY